MWQSATPLRQHAAVQARETADRRAGSPDRTPPTGGPRSRAGRPPSATAARARAGTPPLSTHRRRRARRRAGRRRRRTAPPRGREARQTQLPLERRDGPFQEKPAGGAGRDCQHQRQKGKALHPAAAVGLLQRRSCRARKRSARGSGVGVTWSRPDKSLHESRQLERRPRHARYQSRHNGVKCDRG